MTVTNRAKPPVAAAVIAFLALVSSGCLLATAIGYAVRMKAGKDDLHDLNLLPSFTVTAILAVALLAAGAFALACIVRSHRRLDARTPNEGEVQ